MNFVGSSTGRIFTGLICIGLTISVWASGEVDPGFTASLIRVPAERAYVTRIQPDGKIITFGSFSAVNGKPSKNIIRLNPDGTTDPTFTPPSLNFSGGGLFSVDAIDLQSDGKIIVAGVFDLLDGVITGYRGIIRLNTNGTLDPSFIGDPTVPSILWDVDDMLVLSDDKILAGGRNGFVRLLSNGTVDPSFSTQNRTAAVFQLAIQADGKILLSGSTNLRRLNADGTTDTGYQTAIFSAHVYDIEVQPDGKIVACGQFTHVNSFVNPQVARFNTDGTVDASFNNTFNVTSALAKEVIALPDGKLLVLGGSNNQLSTKNVRRLNPDGTVDLTFVAVDSTSGWDMDLQADGKIILSSDATFAPGQVLLQRLNSDGTLDSSFEANIGVGGEGRKIRVQPDGKILVGGTFNFGNNFRRAGMARFNPDGTIDTTFRPGYTADPANQVSAIDVQLDGKIIVNRYNNNENVKRLLSDGTLDLEFAGTPQARDVKALPNGQTLIAGHSYLKLFNANGMQDVSFAPVINELIEKIAVQPDGKIIIVGAFTQVNGMPRNRIARLNVDGTLDASFNASAGASNSVLDVALQPDGKILIGGRFLGVNLTNRAHIARLNSDGTLDTSFVPTPNSDVLTVNVLPNGKIVFGGIFVAVNNVARNRIARVNPDGTLDTGFNPNSDLTVRDIEADAFGRILVAGDFRAIGGTSRYGIARLLDPASSKYFDYDGDGRADISVFRSSENRWYVFKSSDSTVTQTVFAIAGDVPVPADYDGDLKTDVAIYRPSNGAWWYLASSNGAQINVNWGGEAGDIPRPSDFDGDGKTDFIIFRPTNSTWYRITSTGTVSNFQFGLAGDKPVRGDFDGDGKSDVAIYRPSTGDWWYQSSINNTQLAVRWGISTDIPAPADFDGDGRTDFAVYRPSTGVWYVINSSNGSFLIGPFGISEDKPVPADYDGDGKAELAVFRPSTGIWYQLRTSGGFFAMQFGVGTDTPTPNAFVP